VKKDQTKHRKTYQTLTYGITQYHRHMTQVNARHTNSSKEGLYAIYLA